MYIESWTVALRSLLRWGDTQPLSTRSIYASTSLLYNAHYLLCCMVQYAKMQQWLKPGWLFCTTSTYRFLPVTDLIPWGYMLGVRCDFNRIYCALILCITPPPLPPQSSGSLVRSPTGGRSSAKEFQFDYSYWSVSANDRQFVRQENVSISQWRYVQQAIYTLAQPCSHAVIVTCQVLQVYHYLLVFSWLSSFIILMLAYWRSRCTQHVKCRPADTVNVHKCQNSV